MLNHDPCSYCKSRHRKCIYTDTESLACQLCTEMKVECIFNDSDNSDELPSRDGDHKLQQWQRQITQLTTDLDSMHKTIDQYPIWKLRVENGFIHIESRIRSLHELIEFNRASIRYLSPFRDLISTLNIHFKEVSASVALASTGLIVRHARPRSQMRPSVSDATRIKAFKVMNQLIALYLERYNAYVGFVHAQTFMNYYFSLDDPLSSPIATAICVDTIAYFYPQLDFTEHEKRELGEFFYNHTKNMVLDMYDIPERRLEAVVATSLLIQYLTDILLEYGEARKLTTMALLICHELEMQELPLVEKAMLQRSRACMETTLCTADLIMEDRFDYSRVNHSKPIMILSDEPREIQVYFMMWEYMLKLVGSHYIVAVMERMLSSIIHGHPCELSLDLILQFEPTVLAWWKDLPSELQLCKDPFDLNSARQAIEDAPSSTHMLPLAALYVITAMIQSTLLRPYSSGREKGNMDIIDILRDRAQYLTLCSTQGLIYVMKQNLLVDEEAMPLSVNYMMGILHAVCNVVSCLQIPLLPDMQSILVDCFTQLHSKVLSGHHIPESATQLQSFITSRKYKSNPIEVYQRYPMPRLAMVSDIFNICFRRLNSNVI